MSTDWRWFRVPMTVYDRLPEVGRAVGVYLVLLKHSNEKGECWPSHKRIAVEAGVSERSVRDHLSTLETIGFVERKRRRRDTTIYILPDLAKNGTPLPSKDDKNGKPLPFKGSKNGSFRHQERQESAFKNGSQLPSELEPRTRTKNQTNGRARFVVPSVDEVATYCKSRGNNVDPQAFINHYTSNGWKVGRNQMKDWRAAVRTWERNGFANGNNQAPPAEPLKYRN